MLSGFEFGEPVLLPKKVHHAVVCRNEFLAELRVVVLNSAFQFLSLRLKQLPKCFGITTGPADLTNFLPHVASVLADFLSELAEDPDFLANAEHGGIELTELARKEVSLGLCPVTIDCD